MTQNKRDTALITIAAEVDESLCDKLTCEMVMMDAAGRGYDAGVKDATAELQRQVEPLEAENKRLSEQVRVLTEALAEIVEVTDGKLTTATLIVNEMAKRALTTPTNAETEEDK